MKASGTIAKRLAIGAAAVLIAGIAYHFTTQRSEPTLPEGLAMGNGRVEAVQVDVSTRFAGRVDEILVREGELVEMGQQVARMDTSQL